MSLRSTLICISLLLFYGTFSCFAQNISTDELCKCSNNSPIVEIWDEPIISQKIAGAIKTTFSDEGIEDVAVAITDKNYKTVISFVKTKKDGRFLFKNSKKMNYYVLVCKPGYRAIRLIIRLDPNSKDVSELDKLLLSAS